MKINLSPANILRYALGISSATFFTSIATLLIFVAYLCFGGMGGLSDKGEEDAGIIVGIVLSLLALASLFCGSLVLGNHRIVRRSIGWAVLLSLALAWAGGIVQYLRDSDGSSITFSYFQLSGFTLPIAVISLLLYVLLRIVDAVRKRRSKT